MCGYINARKLYLNYEAYRSVKTDFIAKTFLLGSLPEHSVLVALSRDWRHSFWIAGRLHYVDSGDRGVWRGV